MPVPALPSEKLDEHLASFRVSIPNPNAVQTYLDRNADLLPILRSLCATLRQEFNGETTLALEIRNDPEVEDMVLALLVRQRTYDSDIMNRIDSAIEPYEGDLARAAGWLLVTTDFRSPE